MSDIKVQRGTNDIGNTGGTDTGFTAVGGLADAFEYNTNSMFTHGGSTSSGSNMEGDDMSGAVELTATGTLTFTRQSGSLAQNMRYDWQLIEYIGSAGGANEFIVRSRNTITMSGSSGSASLDTTPTDTSKCIPFITGVRTSQTSNNGDELRVLAYINDSGSLVVEKGSTTNTTVVQVVTVEFTGSNWSVYHGTATSSADTGTITLNTDSDGAGGSTGDVSDWSTAFIEGGFTSTDQGLDSIACRYDEGSATTAVDWDFQSGNSSSHKHFVHVLQNDDMSVTRYTPSGSSANDTNVDITSAGLTTLDTAFVIGTCQGSGGGTAYGRNWRNYRLTSTTNAQHYCHRSGNTINHNIQVIDFENVEDTGGAVSLTPTETSQAQASDTTSLTVEYSVTASETSQAQASDTTTVSSSVSVTPTETSQAQTADQSSLTVEYTVGLLDTSQDQQSDTTSIGSSVSVDAGDTAQAQTSDTTSLSVHTRPAGVSPYLIQRRGRVWPVFTPAPIYVAPLGVTPTETVQVQTSDTVGLTEAASVTLTETTQAQASDQTSVSEDASLAATETSQAQTSDTTTVSESSGISLSETSQAQASDTTAVTEAASVTPTETTQSQTSDTTSVTEAASVAPVETSQAQASDTVVVTVSGSLILTETSQAQASDTVGITENEAVLVRPIGPAQAFVQRRGRITPLFTADQRISTPQSVAPTETAQTQTSGTTTLATSGQLALDGTAQAQTSDTTALTVALTLTGTVQTQTSDTASLTENTSVGLVETAQTQASDTTAIAENASLTANETAQTQTSGLAGVAENQSLVAGETSQTQASDDSSVALSYSLTAADTSQTQASDDTAITEAASLTAVETAQTQTSGQSLVTPLFFATANDSLQAQVSDTTTNVIIFPLVATDTSQQQSSDTADFTVAAFATAISSKQQQVSGTPTGIQPTPTFPVGSYQMQGSAAVEAVYLTPGEYVRSRLGGKVWEDTGRNINEPTRPLPEE